MSNLFHSREMAVGEQNSLLTRIDSLLQCPLCLEECEKPKSLPCHHWLCSQCLTSLIKHESFGNKTVVCPNCRYKAKVPKDGVAGFPAAFVINSLKEIAASGRKQGSPSRRARKKCVKHSKDCDMFCKKCTELICSTCSVAEHRGHSKLSIEEVVDEHRNKLEKSYKQLLCDMNSLTANVHKLTEARNECLSEVACKSEAAASHGIAIMQMVPASVAEVQSEIDK